MKLHYCRRNRPQLHESGFDYYYELREPAMKSYTIELRCDDDTAEKDEIILTAAKVAAKHLFTMACLIAGKRKPQISLRTSDMFVAESEISLAEDITPEVTSGETEEDAAV